MIRIICRWCLESYCIFFISKSSIIFWTNNVLLKHLKKDRKCFYNDFGIVCFAMFVQLRKLSNWQQKAVTSVKVAYPSGPLKKQTLSWLLKFEFSYATIVTISRNLFYYCSSNLIYFLFFFSFQMKPRCSTMFLRLLLFLVIFNLISSGHSYTLWDWQDRQRRRVERQSKRLLQSDHLHHKEFPKPKHRYKV